MSHNACGDLLTALVASCSLLHLFLTGTGRYSTAKVLGLQEVKSNAHTCANTTLYCHMFLSYLVT
jgi:hypothetical protein